MLLKLSDFPDDWVASAPKGKQATSRKCTGLDLSDTTVVGDARSKDFHTSYDEDTGAWSEVRILKNATEAERTLDRIARSWADRTRLEGCVRRSVQRGLRGSSVGKVNVHKLKLSPPERDPYVRKHVDEAEGWQMVIQLRATSPPGKGASLLVYIDWTFLRKGDILGTVLTMDIFHSFDPYLRNHLAQDVARYMSAS